MRSPVKGCFTNSPRRSAPGALFFIKLSEPLFLFVPLRHQVPIRYALLTGSPFSGRRWWRPKAVRDPDPSRVDQAAAQGDALNRHRVRASFRATATIAFCGSPVRPGCAGRMFPPRDPAASTSRPPRSAGFGAVSARRVGSLPASSRPRSAEPPAPTRGRRPPPRDGGSARDGTPRPQTSWPRSLPRRIPSSAP